MKKLIVINGSPRDISISNTHKALTAEIEFFKKQFPELEVKYFKLPKNLMGCMNCNSCIKGCRINDIMKIIISEMKTATDVLIGSPVYLDMPTAQTVAFLTRLNCMAENTDREFFKGKKAHLLSTSFCSGTKTCIHTMMGACEMLGFTIDGRSSREYIVKWSDKKLRGGLSRNDAIYLE